MKKCTIIMILLFLLAMGVANATPVQWASNSHYYELIYPTNGISWEAAKTAAAAMNYSGFQGHLATITSAAENFFITYGSGLGNGNPESMWLGGYQVTGSPEPAGGWTWITGEVFSYNNWASGEPNNNPDGENAIIFQHGFTSDGKEWNDLTSSWLQNGFVVEYEQGSGPAPVPEPATLLLLGLGLLGIVSLRKK